MCRCASVCVCVCVCVPCHSVGVIGVLAVHVSIHHVRLELLLRTFVCGSACVLATWSCS